jgi:CheY-like chemotaxis protein
MPQPAKIRIFVVDDEFVIAATLASILKSQGFDATSYTDPLDALKAARGNPPDLLITDVMMPTMTGIELAIEVQKFCQDCKVLLFSGQAATADLLQAARGQGHDFELILKPVHPGDLLRKIHRAFESIPQQS